MSNTRYFMLIAVLLAVIISRSIGAWCGYKRGDGFQNPPDGVCSNVDIRITMDQFRTLENCTVVEGFLHISLIERAVQEDYEKWSFPELREITGYLRLYRVYGLKTLRHLFPNLAVIGGRQLFSNYALVVYEMPDLEELGLISLRTISRGGVRITKSKKLCYVDTVDWERLGVDAGGQDFKDNKDENQCANYCPESCLTSRVGHLEAKRCWTSQHCQLGLNCRCKVNQTCMSNGTCCHAFCVGGCFGTGPQDCYSCKGVTYQGRCYTHCPPRTFMFSDRRCLTDKECLSLVNNTQDIGKNTKILRDEKDKRNICVTKCPQNYTIQEEGELKNLECVKCQGVCPKVCNSTEITSIEDAEKLNGCSKIIGPLIIQIMSGSNVAQEMEKNLGSIKEVTGYISIRRSYALLTLYFLKSLEIFGHSPLFQNHSLAVMDNTNLQELFPEEQMKKMKFKNGRVFFHGNRKLCLYKIDTFVKYLNLSTAPTEQDISRATNGDLISCSEWHLNLSMPVILHNAVVLNWTKDDTDTRHLMYYIIKYKEIQEDSVIDIYQGRDVCSTDVWMTNEQAPSDDSEPFQTYELNDLKAFTKYAVYVQAYTLPTATYAAITNVETFTTKSYYPSEPLDLEASSDDAHELTVKWKPPRFPNGNVTHYTIVFYKQELAIKSFKQRDYCREPNSAPKETSKEKENEAEKKQNITANCCVCPKSKEEEDAEARKREMEIYFENYLHDQVYCRRYDTLPPDVALRGISWEARLTDFINLDRTTDVNNTRTSKTSDIMVIVKANTSFNNNTSERNAQYNSSLAMEIPEVLRSNVTKVVLSNLKHFQEYNIEVQACHDADINKPNDTKLCSIRAMTAGRTKPSRIMDNINESTINVKIVVNITADVLITWEPPPDPNGLILTYNIFYKRANQENLVPQQICVNSKDYQKHSGYYLANLDHGNWTFQINAVSLAGNGSLTSEKYFLVTYSPDEVDTFGMMSAVTILVIATIVIIVISLMLFVKFRFNHSVLTVISPNINYVPSDHMYTMDDWEVDRDKIKLIRELGQGSFGMVYEGVAKGLGEDPNEETRVAVKTVNDRASFNDRREFLKEATTMKAFDCFHVVKLLGVVSAGQPALVIMELMAFGDLKNYLRGHRPEESEHPGVSPPKLLDILQMAGEIADGMAYLADKKFVHRDLAARNCMVAADKTVKIGDFGMTRDIYETDYYRKGGKGMLPVRWMAPESLKDGVFTSMSDVWSYGVVMWEMVTLAAQPYQGLSNEEVVKYVSDDYIMDVPDRCPDKMAYLMQRCWIKRPKNRPTFKDIIEYLLPHMNSHFQKVSYFFSDGGGTGNGDGCMMRELGHMEENDNCFNSLNSRGAASSKLSLIKANRIYPFNGSPHSEAETLSLYDDDTDPVKYITNEEETLPNKKDLNVDEEFRDTSSKASLSDFTLSVSDSNCPFMAGDLQITPSTTRLQPSRSTLEEKGTGSVLDNLGFVELQPLIKKDLVLTPQSRFTVKSSNPDSSEYVTHQSPTVTEIDLIPNDSHSHDAIINATADLLMADPPMESSSLWQPVQQLSTNPEAQTTTVSTLPAFKLPTLNQPPGGGFHRTALYTPADSNIYSIRNNQHVSSSQAHSQPVSLNTVSVNAEETYLATATKLNYSQTGEINNYKGNSKEISQNSDSHPVIHQQTNGHAPMSTFYHKTAPC